MILAYLYASVQNVPFAIERCTWSLFHIPSKILSDAWQRSGYSEQSPVTRANTTDRYLGRDDDAK
jgi:hypothetical protein